MGWYPLGGLALANSLATVLEAAALFIFMRRRLKGIEGKSVADGAWRMGLAGFVMAIGLLIWNQAAGGMNRWIIALGGVVLGGVVYLGAVVALKIPEIHLLMNAIRSRVLRR